MRRTELPKNDNKENPHRKTSSSSAALSVPLSDPTVGVDSSTKVSTTKFRSSAKNGEGAKLPLTSHSESDTLLLNNSSTITNSTTSTTHQPIPSSVVFVELPPPLPPKNSTRKTSTQTSASIFDSFGASPSSSPTNIGNSSLLDSPPSAATLDISSSTTIINSSGPSVMLNSTSAVEEPPQNVIPKNSSSNKPPLVELHFNPLYTITIEDVGGEQVISRRANFPPPPPPPLPPHSPRGRGEDHHHHQHILPPPSLRSAATPTSTTSHRSLRPIYLALLLAGIGFLLPYNSFVIAADYFQHRFPANPTIVFDMSTTYIVVALCTVLVSNAVVEFIPLFWRLNAGFLLSLLVMSTVAVYEIWERMGGYLPNLVLIGVAAVGCTLQQSTFYGYTSMLPQKYTQAVMTGESAAGIFVSASRILTKALVPADEQLNTTLFFLVAIVLIAACALLHALVLPPAEWEWQETVAGGGGGYYSSSGGGSSGGPTAHATVASSGRVAETGAISSDGRSSARSMLRRINENLGLVQMYERQERQQQQQQMQSSARFTSTFSARPSIYSTTSASQLHLDGMIDSTGSGTGSGSQFHPRARPTSGASSASGNNVKVASILRTDSMECVLPFGIDDDELMITSPASAANVVEEAPNGEGFSRPGPGGPRGPLRTTETVSDFEDDLVPEVVLMSSVPLSHQDSTVGGNDFKMKSATSKLVTFLAWLENFTNMFRVVGILARRFRRCLNSLKPSTANSSSSTSLRRKLTLRRVIIQRTWPHITSILLVYFTTLIIFPGIESEIGVSCSTASSGSSSGFAEWMPIILMAVFNVTDFAGKLLSTCFYHITGAQLLAVAFARLLLIPAMALCVTPRFDPFFGHPVWPIFFTMVLGLTNGIFGSLPMILAPARVHESLREMTGNLMTFSYIVGLTSGSFASYQLHDWIDLHSPLPNMGGNFSSAAGNYSGNHYFDHCADYFGGSGGSGSVEDVLHQGGSGEIGGIDRNALIHSLGNGSFTSGNFTAELIKSVTPELLQNSTVFSASIYHF
ncbi:hypothetical protein TYRP_008998 [Tyrophagus putrescentiae]|nr:hypothetical protein TYRP_008998 [Tyrophagus putrescentiae]